jgi:hypothetical protein
VQAARATAGLARRLGDLDRAEDAIADRRHRATDRIRRERNAVEKHELLARLDAVAATTIAIASATTVWNCSSPASIRRSTAMRKSP